MTENVFQPRIVDHIESVQTDEFDIGEERLAPLPAAERYATLTPDDELMLSSLDVALDAADILMANDEEELLSHPSVPEPEPTPPAPPPAEPEDEEEPEEESAPEEKPQEAPQAPEETPKAPVQPILPDVTLAKRDLARAKKRAARRRRRLKRRRKGE